jgi:hypothetical protein
MSSAAEAELGALFINAKTAISMCQMLVELGHPQPHTPMQTDNATAHALLTNKILPKSTKSHGYALPLAKMPQHTRLILLLLETRHTEASPNQPPQICPPNNINTCQQSRIHETLQNYNNTNNVRTTNQNIGINKIVCQESTPNTKVQDQNHQHSHSKKCLNIPTARVC